MIKKLTEFYAVVDKQKFIDKLPENIQNGEFYEYHIPATKENNIYCSFRIEENRVKDCFFQFEQEPHGHYLSVIFDESQDEIDAERVICEHIESMLNGIHSDFTIEEKNYRRF